MKFLINGPKKSSKLSTFVGNSRVWQFISKRKNFTKNSIHSVNKFHGLPEKVRNDKPALRSLFCTQQMWTRHRQYLVLVLRYWCFGRYWYWYWYWKSQFPRYWYWYWYWKIDSEGIGIGIGIDLKMHSSPNLQQIPKWHL